MNLAKDVPDIYAEDLNFMVGYYKQQQQQQLDILSYRTI